MPPVLHPPIRLLLLGATGQVGRHLLQLALDDPRVSISVQDVGRVIADGAGRYDAILLDPPKFGRGPEGEVWKLEEHLPALITGGLPRL